MCTEVYPLLSVTPGTDCSASHNTDYKNRKWMDGCLAGHVTRHSLGTETPTTHTSITH